MRWQRLNKSCLFFTFLQPRGKKKLEIFLILFQPNQSQWEHIYSCSVRISVGLHRERYIYHSARWIFLAKNTLNVSECSSALEALISSTHLQWWLSQLHWMGPCPVCSEPTHWTGTPSQAPTRAPPTRSEHQKPASSASREDRSLFS